MRALPLLAFALVGGCYDLDALSDRAGQVQPNEDAGVDGNIDAPLSSDASPNCKLIFVTTGAFTGNLGGLDGAATLCANEAGHGRWQAWLSTTVMPAGDRFSGIQGPWCNDRGQVVFQSIGELPRAPIGSTAAYVWTGTSATGAPAKYGDAFLQCGDWSDATTATGGEYGYSTLTNNNWTALQHVPCNRRFHLYCLEVD